MVTAGIGHWRRVGFRCGHGDAILRTVLLAIVDDQCYEVAASDISGEGWSHGVSVGEGGRAAARRGYETPGIGEGVAVRVAAGTAIQGNGCPLYHRLIGAGISHWLHVSAGGRDGRCLRGTVERPIADDQFQHEGAGLIRNKLRGHAAGIAQGRGTAVGPADEAPLVRQLVTVRIGAGGPVQSHGLTFHHLLVVARVGDGGSVTLGGSDRNPDCFALILTIADHQADHVAAGQIRLEGWRHGVRVIQGCQAAIGSGHKLPLIGQPVTICILAVLTVQRDAITCNNGLIGTGICDGHRVCFRSGNGHVIWSAFGFSVVDDQFNYVITGGVRLEAGPSGLGITQRGGAATRA